MSKADLHPCSRRAFRELSCVVSVGPLSSSGVSTFTPSFSLKSSLPPCMPSPHPPAPDLRALPRNSTTVKACMIYLALSLCGVNCFLYFYSSLWPPGLTYNYLKGENTMKMETTSSASVGSQLQTLPYTELAYGVKFCTQCGPASAGLWSCRSRISSLRWLPSI